MRKAIIINDANNESLLRFTQTKLFFDAKNEGIDFFDDCKTVSTLREAKQIAENSDVILHTGDFLTTTYRTDHKLDTSVHYATNDKSVIKFDKDKPIDFKKRQYQSPSKQNYIVENLLKTCMRNKKILYLENTESEIMETDHWVRMKNLYGLASGWKTMREAIWGGYEGTITVYDNNQRQLDFAKFLHSCDKLPDKIDEPSPLYGKYKPSDYIKENWSVWHNINVEFELMDLFDIPEFKSNSRIWVSNIFHYEPTMFTYGYDFIKTKQKQLAEKNSDCIIIE